VLQARRRPQRESRLLSFAIRLGINAVALALASEFVPGFDIHGWPSLLATAFIFGVVNAVIKPVAQVLGCPLSCLTLGFFVLIVNAAMLGLTAWIAGRFNLEVDLDNVWAAFLAALLVSAVSAVLNAVVGRPLRRAFR
jgi:putative membrane protein